MLGNGVLSLLHLFLFSFTFIWIILFYLSNIFLMGCADKLTRNQHIFNKISIEIKTSIPAQIWFTPTFVRCCHLPTTWTGPPLLVTLIVTESCWILWVVCHSFSSHSGVYGEVLFVAFFLFCVVWYLYIYIFTSCGVSLCPPDSGPDQAGWQAAR